MNNEGFDLEQKEEIKKLHQQKKEQWYYGNPAIIVAFLFVGPLALPLVFANPYMSKRKKIVASLIIIVLTLLLLKVTISSIDKIIEYYKLVFGFSEIN